MNPNLRLMVQVLLLVFLLGTAFAEKAFQPPRFIKKEDAAFGMEGKPRVEDAVTGVSHEQGRRAQRYQVTGRIEGGLRHARQVIEDQGFRFGGRVGSLPDRYIAWKHWEDAATPHSLHDHMSEFTPQEPVLRTIRTPSGFWDAAAGSDFPLQWNLHGGYAGYEMNSLPNLNVLTAWARHGMTGEGVVVAVVDDGVDKTNTGLADRHVDELEINIHESTPGRHGTEMAGIVVAKADAECNIGIAPRARFVDIPLIADHLHTDADEATALSHGLCGTEDADDANCVRIYTNSWGPSDEGVDNNYPGPLTMEAIALTASRGGFVFFAAGNGRKNHDNSNLDGYANHPAAIAVGAVNYRGYRSSYSEPGENVFVTAPSNDYDFRGVVAPTPGLHGCTKNAGGTSAAAPQVAALTALMLQKNPALNYRDVKHILTLCSDIIDPFNQMDHVGVWVQNGAGFNHSSQYGFGLPDADYCLDLAAAWKGVPTMNVEEVEIPIQHLATKQSTRNTIRFNISAVDVPEIRHLETVALYLFMECGSTQFTTSASLGKVGVTLRSPYGTTAVLLDIDNNLAIPAMHHMFTAAKFWGEDPAGRADGATGADHWGTWSIDIINYSRSCYVDMASPVLTLYGTADAPLEKALAGFSAA